MKLRELVPLVVAELPQIPTATVVFELREAAREFCKRSRVWTDELKPVLTQAGRTQYAFNVPEGAEVCQVNEVWLAGEQLCSSDPGQARAAVREGSTDPFFWCTNFADVWINPPPAAGLKLVADVVLRPNFATEAIPDEVVAGRERVIALGAMARLLSMPNKEWTNPDMAMVRTAEFEDGINGASLDAASGGVAGSLSVVSYDVRSL